MVRPNAIRALHRGGGGDLDFWRIPVAQDILLGKNGPSRAGDGAIEVLRVRRGKGNGQDGSETEISGHWSPVDQIRRLLDDISDVALTQEHEFQLPQTGDMLGQLRRRNGGVNLDEVNRNGRRLVGTRRGINSPDAIAMIQSVQIADVVPSHIYHFLIGVAVEVLDDVGYQSTVVCKEDADSAVLLKLWIAVAPSG